MTRTVGPLDQKYGSPFVCHKEPFVWPKHSVVVPLIGVKKPFVGNKKISAGFSLIELLTTLTVAGVLVAIAVPAMTAFLQSNSLTTATNDLIADLSYARSEVLKRQTNAANTRITAGLCSSSDGATCGGTWTDGWLVFVDNDDSTTLNAGDVLLRVHQRLSAGNTMVAAPANLILYTNQGLLRDNGSAGLYTICNNRLRQSRTIRITPGGRPGLERGVC